MLCSSFNFFFGDFNSSPDSKDKAFVHKLFELKLSEKQQHTIIQGIKEASNYDLLLTENHNSQVQQQAALALFSMSNVDSFLPWLDQLEYGLLSTDIKQRCEHNYQRWGWHWPQPLSDNGKKMAMDYPFW